MGYGKSLVILKSYVFQDLCSIFLRILFFSIENLIMNGEHLAKSQNLREKNKGESIYFDQKKQCWRAELKFTSRSEKIRKTFSAKDISVLMDKISDYKSKAFSKNGLPLFSELSFKSYAENWLITTEKMKLKPTSYIAKCNSLNYQVYPYIGDIPITEITYMDIQKMINSLFDKGYSYSTIKKAFNAVSGCLRHFRVTNQAGINPCEGVVLPKNIEHDLSDYKAFTPDQCKLIEKEAMKRHGTGSLKYRYGPAILFLLYTGMRISELSALTWNDVDFKNNHIIINKNSVVVKTDGHYKHVTQSRPKTKAGVRVIPISQKTHDMLIELKKQNGKCKYVVATANLKQPQPHTISRSLKDILKNIGISDEDHSYGVHALRHTFASMLFRNGCEVRVVSDLLGHANSKITENYYIHLIQSQRVKAIEDLDKFFD
ncbi:MAG: tyrosine-type recombinase/integrase [Clostridia bacterium]|nr:tyrosine-type recombinase/integrase [Clostridia bacterium]